MNFPSDAALEVPPRRKRLAAREAAAPQTWHDVVHVHDVGTGGASDPVVMKRALDDARVVITLDTDFGELIARSESRLPSIVLFRGAVTRRPSRQAALLLENLDQFAADLVEGAIVVIGDDRIRVRRLPIE